MFLGVPFRIHNLRKSAREHWSFLIAAERVTYAFAAPAFPFCFNRPMLVRCGREVVKEEKKV